MNLGDFVAIVVNDKKLWDGNSLNDPQQVLDMPEFSELIDSKATLLKGFRKGSPKQIAWAKQIRMRWFKGLMKDLVFATIHKAKSGFFNEEKYNVILINLNFISRTIDARYYIDYQAFHHSSTNSS